MDVMYTIVKFFVEGGIFMYPILLVFAVGVAVSIERYVTLTLLTKKNQAVWAKVQPLLAQREFDKARELTAKDDSTVSQLLSMGLERQGAVRHALEVRVVRSVRRGRRGELGCRPTGGMFIAQTAPRLLLAIGAPT